MRQLVVALTVLALTAEVSQADVFNMGSGLTNLEFVTVGNPGNADDTRYDAAGIGAVDYVYQIGKYEITTAQYVQFLNAVAANDMYGLYSSYMSTDHKSCQIQRSGPSTNSTYSVATELANRPVTDISWGDAARFCNWLQNGQPTGPQGLATTEDGAYFLNGVTSREALMAVTRKADAKYWIVTEDEWHKAAYHKNDGVTGNYWDYPTISDTIDMSMANYGDIFGSTTDVGAYVPSPYGTFDQGGNVWEWNETAATALARRFRGGTWEQNAEQLRASTKWYVGPTIEDYDLGFRISSVPEPGSMALCACGAAAGVAWWWRKRTANIDRNVEH